MILLVKDPENWGMLKQRITVYLKFNCADYSDNFLQRRIEVRLRALNLNSYADYSQALLRAGEREALLTELMIHVTNFFRDYPVWASFEQKVIPCLVQMKRSDVKGVKVWSAGCSTGEEPYGIVICLLRKLGIGANLYDIKVIATDYDAKTVSFAKDGIYQESQFKEMPETVRDAYFTRIPDGFKVKPAVSSRVAFEVDDIHNVHQHGLDVIFCRNTVIYFGAEAKAKLYVRFYEMLNPGGFLILGKTEILNGPATGMFETFDGTDRIYRKPLF